MQATFLSTDTNKMNIITMLKGEMKTEGIQVKQAVEDTDVLNVHTTDSVSEE